MRTMNCFSARSVLLTKQQGRCIVANGLEQCLRLLVYSGYSYKYFRTTYNLEGVRHR